MSICTATPVASHEVIFVDTMEKARECFDAVYRSPDLLYWDTETTGLLVRSGTQDVARLIQVSVRPWDKAWAFDARTDEYREILREIFDAADEICAHNTKFDLHVLETFGIDLLSMFDQDCIWDTTWLAHLNDERVSRKLKDLGDLYLGFEASKEDAKLKKTMKDNGWDWDTVPLDELVTYGGMDTIIGGELFDLLYPRVEPYAQEAIVREQRLLPYVYAMERNGIKMDVEGISELITIEEGKMREALDTLAIIFKQDVVPKADPKNKTALNLASGAQLKLAFKDIGQPISNTQAVTFHKMAALSDGAPQEAARAILTYKKSSKTLGTYLYAWQRDISADGRIHPSFNTMGTITGRFSSSGPNFQNISKAGGLRKLMIADSEDHALVVADYEQMELRQFAHYADDERMRAAFLAGTDLYQQAADVMGVTRAIGKMITLASQYGAGWKKTKEQAIKFAYTLGQEDQVPELHVLPWHDILEKFHHAYRVRHLQAITEKQAKARGLNGEGYIRTTGGRRMRPKVYLAPRVNGLAPIPIYIYKDLGNSLIQGSCADIMKESIIAAGDAGYGPAMRLTVHDELVLSVPKYKAREVLEEMSKLMERPEYVPALTVDGDVAYRYGDAK